MRIEKRVRALESRFKSDPVVLYFGDGSTREIHGPRDFLLRLLVAAAWGRDLSPGQQEQLDSPGLREPQLRFRLAALLPGRQGRVRS